MRDTEREREGEREKGRKREREREKERKKERERMKDTQRERRERELKTLKERGVRESFSNCFDQDDAKEASWTSEEEEAIASRSHL